MIGHTEENLIISRIQAQLVTTPLTFGSITLSKLYRAKSKKPLIDNYVDIEFSTYLTENFEPCSETTIRVQLQVYAKNEIMARRMGYALYERLNNARINNDIYLVNGTLVDKVVELTKNEYVQRIDFFCTG